MTFSFEVYENNYKVYDWSTNDEEKAKDYKEIIIAVLRKNIHDDKYRSFKLISTAYNEKKRNVHIIKEIYNQYNFEKPFTICDTICKTYRGYSNKSKNNHKNQSQKKQKQKIKEKQLTFNFY